ncbi:MAG: AraC family transcriptional regulator [Polyangiaceae bacterium]|nr:AraC family transcriptional regulator [Polyangiaceae bacterium]
MPNPTLLTTPRRVRDEPHRLTAEFPCAAGEWEQRDAPINALHRHDFFEIGYCLQGEGVFVVEDKLFHFGPGDVVVMGPDEHHFAQSKPGTTSRWFFCFSDPQELVGSPRGNRQLLDPYPLAGPEFRNCQHPADAPRLSSLVSHLATEVLEKRSDWRDGVRALMWPIMVELQRLPGRRVTQDTERRQALDRIARALDIVAQRSTEDVSVEELARVCGMSSETLRRSFQRALQCSPKQYQQRLRVEHAARLLSAGMGVLEAGMAAGFASPSNFYRQFTTIMGSSPKRWQRT